MMEFLTKISAMLDQMKPAHREALRMGVIFILIVVLFLMFWPAEAHYWQHEHDHNDDNNADTNGCMCVTGGLSDEDLAKGMAMAMSGGGHELDYSTTDNQLSIVYSRQLDEDNEGAYSIKYGRRWDRFGKALFHVTAVPEQGNDLGNWMMVGTTIRW